MRLATILLLALNSTTALGSQPHTHDTKISQASWKAAGLHSAALRLPSTHLSPQQTTCPQECSCGYIDGVSCSAPTPTSPLPTDILHTIQTLTLYGYSNLGSQLQKFQRLQELSMYDCALNPFPELPTSLTHLRITNSRLADVTHIEKLNNLQILNLAHNNITVVDFWPLFRLLNLDLSHNPLQDLPNLPSSLISLKMNHVPLYNQPVEWDLGLPNLRHLSLKNMHHTVTPLLEFPKLRHLDISRSKFTKMPYLERMPLLHELNASHVKLKEVTHAHLFGAKHLLRLDLSFTKLKTLPDRVFSGSAYLKELYMHDTKLEFIEEFTLEGIPTLEKLILRNNPSLQNIEDNSLSTLLALNVLDVSSTNIKTLPMSITKIKLRSLIADNIHILCDCHAQWLPEYIQTPPQHMTISGLTPIPCADGTTLNAEQFKQLVDVDSCEAPDITSQPDITLTHALDSTAVLECNTSGEPYPVIVWQSPTNKIYAYNTTTVQPWFSKKFRDIFTQLADESNEATSLNSTPRIVVLENGQLHISNLTKEDVGLYRCTAVNAMASITSTTSLWLTTERQEAYQTLSLLFGIGLAMIFLFTTLLVQLIRYIINRMGWECGCCKGKVASRAYKVKRMLEGVHHYRTSQLERLKDNYNSQVAGIKESCYMQMEKLSEGYSQQCKHLQNIKDYSAGHLTTARDQYLDQVNRVREYSMSQMNKVSENYVFQRQRVRKYSAHQMFKLRETYKYQQRTLNKILENMPDIYLQNCRSGGSCNRTDSIILDDDIHGLDIYYKMNFSGEPTSGEPSEDAFYTPSSTLTRAHRRYLVQQHRKMSDESASVNESFYEAQLSLSSPVKTQLPPVHSKHSRSHSSSSPLLKAAYKGTQPPGGHRRAASACLSVVPEVKSSESTTPDLTTSSSQDQRSNSTSSDQTTNSTPEETTNSTPDEGSLHEDSSSNKVELDPIATSANYSDKSKMYRDRVYRLLPTSPHEIDKEVIPIVVQVAPTHRSNKIDVHKSNDDEQAFARLDPKMV